MGGEHDRPLGERWNDKAHKEYPLLMTDFQRDIYAVVQKIPKGQTMTYKEVAKAAVRPKAYRAVGNALNKNYDPNIPCHRVVKSDGALGGYNRGREMKGNILREEQKNIRH